ncbi:MAG: PTS sugar transporter subunit IIC [Fusobacteriaceae bacterium]|nr:PTS sugar transporter subunit IIC [Fusobacteriaceae bacterium]
MKFQDFVNNKVLPKAGEISNNRFLKAVSNGFMSLMPVIIIGAIFSLLNGLAIKPYQEFIVKIGLKPLLTIPNMITNDILALYAVFFIAYNLAKSYDKDPGIAGMISLASFLAITPIVNTTNIIKDFVSKNNITIPEDLKINGFNAIPYDWIGSRGLFVAIIVALVSTIIYNYLLTKGISIKLPDSVPPTIGKSFAGLIPGFVIMILFMLIDRAMTLIPNVNGIHSFIYTVIQGPVEKLLGNNIWSFLFAIFTAQFLWFFGIHGITAIILPIFYPVWTSLTMANINAMNQGVSVYELPNIINRSFFSVYALVGGSGATLGICLYMTLKAKSKQYKTLGKLSWVAGLCGINEPLIFGIPIVLNPYMIIPFILAPFVSIVLAYILTVINILPRLTTIIPLGTPVVMSGFLAGGVAGWRVALFQVVIIIISAIIYLPFFKVIDEKAFKEENL